MIGICTPFQINNYGTKLQAYAVQNKIKELGLDYEIINFNKKSDLRPNKLYYRYCNKSFIKSKLKKKKKADINIKIRNDAISSFDNSHYKLTKVINGYNNLVKYSKKYDALICGSDQIWLPSSINHPTATLEFGAKGVRRISFAPSFGLSEIPKNQTRRYRRFLNKFDYISVRETSGYEIIKSVTNKEAKVILDPTLTVNRQVWDKLCSESRINIKEKYIFCYFLGASEEHRKSVYEIAKKNNLKIVTLPHFKEFNKADEELTDIRLYDVTPCDFISLIRNAEIVCTDSFHGTVFSILYHKNVYSFERFNSNDKKSTNSRIHSLMSLLEINNRIVSNSNNYYIDENKIDYDRVDKNLNALREETNSFLEEAFKDIKRKEVIQNSFECPKEADCCGCTACKSICPKGCITMVQDNRGFHYPQLSYPERCIHCNLCNLVCPNKKERNVVHSVQEPKSIISAEDSIREKSSSGGIFYHVAKKILDNGGLICGAAYNKDFNVQHIIVDDEKDLINLIGSKYSESDLNNIFVNIKDCLDNNKKVLFVGTPCQVHGLKSYLKKEYENLFTIDLLCYGIQSPVAWNRYKEYISNRFGKIENINMRDKSNSWQNYSMKIDFKSGETYLSSKNEDPYLKSYSKGLYLRPSCYKCDLKAFPRKSDITIGDYWDVDKITPNKNDGKGISIIFLNTKKGQDIIANLVDDKMLFMEDVDINNLRKYHLFYGKNAKKNPKSKKFFKLLNTNTRFDIIIKKCKEPKVKQILKKQYKKFFRK